MKKIRFLVVALLTFGFCQAQYTFTHGTSTPGGAYTNTASDTMNYVLSKSYNTVSVGISVVRNSGTLAGTAVLYSSIGGTYWAATGDTLTLTNATLKTAIWNKYSAARYWKIITSGGTTVTATATGKLSVD